MDNIFDIFSVEDIIYEIIRSSPWLLISPLINKTWYNKTQLYIKKSLSKSFNELCFENNYVTIM